MTPTEKHLEAARALLADLFGDAIIEKPSLQIVAEHLAKAEREASANLISIIADIRQKSGVGGKPMLGELADAIEARIAKAEREGMKRAADIARDLPACELTSVSPSGGITPKMAFGVGADAQRSAIERSILSEAGKG